MIFASVLYQAPPGWGEALAFLYLMLFAVVPITVIINIFVGMAMGFVTKAGGGTSLFADTFAGLVGSIGTIALTLWLLDNGHFELTKTVAILMFCSTFVITAILSWAMMVGTKKLGKAWSYRSVNKS